MDVTMRISSDALSEDQLDRLIRQLAGTLQQETDLAPVIPATDGEPGAKGDPVTIGALALTFLSSGAAVALFEVLKIYFGREPSLTISLKRPDGSEVNFSARNMEPARADETLGRLEKILEG
jgi:hypothetical protein